MADAKLKFLPSLDDEQLEYAEIIGKKAKAFGIPPALAISVAYQESGLRPNVARGKSGEFGIMQVMPSTGKTFGFNNKDLADPEKNIEAGLMVLQKALMDMNGDPRLAVIAYNAGPNNPFFSGGPLPKITENYLKSLKGWGTFDQTGTMVDVNANIDAYVKESNEQTDQGQPGGELVRRTPLPNTTGPSQAEIDRQKMVAQATGAGVGLAAASKNFVAQKAGDAAEMLSRRREEGKINARVTAGMQPPTMAPAGAPTTPMAPSGGLPGPTPAAATAARPGLPGPSGVRTPPPVPGLTLTGNIDTPYAGPGSANANYLWKFGGTDTDLLKVTSMSDEEGGGARAVKERTSGLARARSGMPGYTLREEPSGVMTIENYREPKQSFVQQGPAPTATTGPASTLPPGSAIEPPPVPGAVVQRTPPRPPAPPKPLSGLDQVKKLFTEIGGFGREMGGFAREAFAPVGRAAAAVATPALKYGLPPLALAQAAGEGVEAFHQAQGTAPDYTKAGLTGLTALGTGLSAFPATAALGAPLAATAATANAVRDRYRQIKDDPEAYRQQVNQMLTNVDPMGNPL